MSAQNGNVLAAVDAILAGKELLDQPRSLLLLRLCQFALLVSSDKTEHYWRLLQAVQNKLPADLQGELTALRSTLEESLPTGAKGFTAEMLAEIQAARQLPAEQVEETKRRLRDIEMRLQKRLMPFGKGPVWVAMVNAWQGLNRPYALQLLKNCSAKIQENTVAVANKQDPLSPDEWTILADRLGLDRAATIVIDMLDDQEHKLSLSQPLLAHTAAQIRNALQGLAAENKQAEIGKALNRYGRLLGQHAQGELFGQVAGLLEELFALVVKAPWLELAWLLRFDIAGVVVGFAAQARTLKLDVIPLDFADRLAAKTPPHMVNFVRAEFAGVTVAPEQAEAALTALLSATGQDALAEEWYLVHLVKRGLGAEAMRLAAGSPRAAELLPRLRRAWLCSHSETAGAAISPADMAGDPIGEFLAQGTVEQQARYLRSATGGACSVPGALWAGVGTDTEAEGLRGFWGQLAKRQKSVDEQIHEYLLRNPLYSSYRRDTKKELQFAECLRINGFGDYRFQAIDGALTAALCAWGDQDANQARSVTRAMWNAIRPDDRLLMVDWLRNDILTRCVNVFAADPATLTQDFLDWFKRELVEKGRTWQSGNTQFTLRFPPTTPFQFCVMAASSVSGVSPARRDQLVRLALEKFDADAALMEAAARLFNSDKALLDLALPVQPRTKNLTPAWQQGIVRNAERPILQAILLQAQQGRAAAQAQPEAAPA